jgi:hypothetical protein
MAGFFDPFPGPKIRESLYRYYREVGRRVTLLMEWHEMGDAELAILCGVPPIHIYHLRNGVPGYVHEKLVELVAQALETKPDQLWDNPPDI